MSWLLPIPVVVPLLAAAVNVLLDHVTPRWLHNAVTIAGIGTSFVFSLIILFHSMPSEHLHWFGGWRPRRGVPLGIAFTADPLGAGMAALASGLTLVALIYSLTFVESAAR